MPMHAHAFHELIFIHAGCMYVTDRSGQELKAMAGDCLLYPEQISHQERSDPETPVETTFLSFHGDLSGHIQHLPQVGERVGQLAHYVVDDYAKCQGKSIDATAVHYLNLIALELAKYRNTSPDHQVVVRAREWMQAHIPEKVSLDDLAKHCHLSKFHFARLYRDITGLSPIADLKRMRLNLAKGMLQSTRLPLKAVADQTGFANEYHLSREIKREYGHSPSYFRV